MAEARVRLGFRNATDGQIVAMAAAVLAGMTHNAAFPRPPVKLSALQKALDQFQDAIAAQASGGTVATAHKHNKRRDVIPLLRTLAYYVEGHCDNDLPTLLSSGFPAKSMNRAKSPCLKAVIVSLT